MIPDALARKTRAAPPFPEAWFSAIGGEGDSRERGADDDVAEAVVVRGAWTRYSAPQAAVDQVGKDAGVGAGGAGSGDAHRAAVEIEGRSG